MKEVDAWCYRLGAEGIASRVSIRAVSGGMDL